MSTMPPASATTRRARTSKGASRKNLHASARAPPTGPGSATARGGALSARTAVAVGRWRARRARAEQEERAVPPSFLRPPPNSKISRSQAIRHPVKDPQHRSGKTAPHA
jgi:hypothetical protein